MPYDFHWHDEAQTIIRFDVHGKITWQDWHEAVELIVAELAKHAYQIDIIFDDKVGMPPGNPLPHIKWAKDKLGQIPNLNRVVTISNRSHSALIKAFVSIITKVSGSSPIVTTMDEAMAIIEAARGEEIGA
jgi:hypothetical protein